MIPVFCIQIRGRKNICDAACLVSRIFPAVIKAFETGMDAVPVWAWLLWLPQLLVALDRPQAHTYQHLLRRMAVAYPQALFYAVHERIIDKRDQHARIKQRIRESETTVSVAPAVDIVMDTNSGCGSCDSAAGKMETSSSAKNKVHSDNLLHR